MTNQYVLRDFALLRTPRLPVEFLARLSQSAESLDGVVRELLSQAFFDEALFIASPSLWERARDWIKEPHENPGVAVSIGKYIQRMSSRATPFGLFATTLTVRVNQPGSTLRAPFERELIRSVKVDSQLAAKLCAVAYRDEARLRLLRLYPNDTLQVQGGTARYIAFDYTDAGVRKYRLAEIEWSPFLKEVLEIAREGLTIGQLVDRVATEFETNVDRAHLTDLVTALFDQQILTVDYLLRLTAGDVFDSLVKELPPGLIEGTDRLSSIIRKLQELNCSQPGVAAERYWEIRDDFSALGIDHPIQTTFHVEQHAIPESAIAISTDITDRIHHGVNLYLKMISTRSVLDDFRDEFVDRFGDSEVPLLVALDEATGIAFNPHSGERPSIIRGIMFGAMDADRRQIRESPGSSGALCRFLQDGMRAGDGDYLELSAEVVERIAASNFSPFSSPSSLAWCSLWGDESSSLVEIRPRFSAQPGRIFGRFANNNQQLHAELQGLIESADPEGEIAAEIVHLPQDRLGNIACRPNLSEYEIGIRTGTSPMATAIPLNDLMVSVISNKVRIRSASLGAFVSLRMSNAHNYSAPESLSIYQFLNALANDGQVSQSLISPRAAFPEWRCTPGLTYKGSIIERPTWLLDEKDLLTLQDLAPSERYSLIQQWRGEYRWPRWVAIASTDNVLPIDLDCAWMVGTFASELRRMTTATLTDVFPLGLRPYVRGRDGRYSNELLIPIVRAAPPLRGHIATDEARGQAVAPFSTEVKKSAGSDWLHFQVYVQPSLQNRALREIRKRLESLQAQHGIVWFYVRYRDKRGSHLRIRMHGSKDQLVTTAFGEFAAALSALESDGVISEYSVGSYLREATRYGGHQALRLCEEIFCRDSQVCLRFIDQAGEECDYGIAGIFAADQMLIGLGLESIDQRLQFAKRASADFGREFGFGISAHKAMGRRYKELLPEYLKASADLTSSLSTCFLPCNDELFNRWLQIESIVLDSSKRYEIRWSLVHMRLNRILDRAQRNQEAVIWDMLRRILERKKHLPERAAHESSYGEGKSKHFHDIR